MSKKNKHIERRPHANVLGVAVSASLMPHWQSLSVASVQPAGQQPSLSLHWTIWVPAQTPWLLQTSLLVHAT